MEKKRKQDMSAELTKLFTIMFVSFVLFGCRSNNSATEVKLKTISVGAAHAFALYNDGKVYAVGYNIGGQLGLGDTANRIPLPKLFFKRLNSYRSV
jgi:alpha-tubulin suppressor-like RCC1 family protein